MAVLGQTWLEQLVPANCDPQRGCVPPRNTSCMQKPSLWPWLEAGDLSKKPGLGELGEGQQRRAGARDLKRVVGRGGFALPLGVQGMCVPWVIQ